LQILGRDPYDATGSDINLYPVPFTQIEGIKYKTSLNEEFVDVLSAAATVPFGNTMPYQKVLSKFFRISAELPNLSPYFRAVIISLYKYK